MFFFLNSWKKNSADLSWVKKYPNVKVEKFRFPNKFLNLMFWYLDWPKIDYLVGSPASTRGGDPFRRREAGLTQFFFPKHYFLEVLAVRLR